MVRSRDCARSRRPKAPPRPLPPKCRAATGQSRQTGYRACCFHWVKASTGRDSPQLRFMRSKVAAASFLHAQIATFCHSAECRNECPFKIFRRVGIDQNAVAKNRFLGLRNRHFPRFWTLRIALLKRRSRLWVGQSRLLDPVWWGWGGGRRPDRSRCLVNLPRGFCPKRSPSRSLPAW